MISRRFARKIHPFLLISPVTALVIASCTLVGGGALLYLLAGLGIAVNIVAYWFSDTFESESDPLLLMLSRGAEGSRSPLDG
jgi:type IV secretory pathway TrbD component